MSEQTTNKSGDNAVDLRISNEEQTIGNRTAANAPDADAPTAEMIKYGITRIPVAYFHYKSFRYTSLKEAVAYAKRETRA